MTLGITLTFVAISGVGAFVHQRTSVVAVRAATGAAVLIAALGPFFCGVLLVT